MKRASLFFLISLVFSFLCLFYFEPTRAQNKSSDEELAPQQPAPSSEQTGELKQVPQMIKNAKSAGADFEQRELFQSAKQIDSAATAIDSDAQVRELLSDGVILDLNKPAIEEILKENVESLVLPLPDGKGGTLELELVKANIFAPGFTVKTSSPTTELIDESLGVHYRGIVKGNDHSVAAISIFKNEVMGFYSTEADGNSILGRLGGNNPTDRHVLYAEKDLKVSSDFHCDTKDPEVTLPESVLQAPIGVAATCVRIYIEANYDLFVNKGSVANTTSYLTGMFNQSATLFSNDGIPVSISEFLVWNSPSPYDGAGSQAVLDQFRTTRTSFNGDVAHLVTLDRDFGGIAYVNTLCNNSYRYAVSDIDSTFNNVPTYSWSVNVFTHETGHSLGSRHTHACAWNGDNTAIDGCYTPEGSCPQPGLPSGGGTMMSYCHLTSVGINFSFGFGPQPRNVIVNSFNNATCLVECGGGGNNKPNLTPYQPSGWSDKIVVSTGTGTNTDSSPIYSTDTIYVDWAEINNGNAATAATFNSTLYVDGVVKQGWTTPPPLNVNNYANVLDYSIGSLSVGTHTLRIVLDSSSVIAESNESDNEYTKTFTVSSLSQPNLTPYQPSGWSDKIVASTGTGTNIDSGSISPTDTIYIDWAELNNGNAATAVTFNSTLYVDGVVRTFWTTPPPLNPNFYAYVQDYSIGSLSAGQHTLRIVADSSNVIGESNESDNEYTKTITVGNKGGFDFDGDIKTDVAIWRKLTGVWYIVNSSNGTTTTRGWGDQNYGDIPVPGDYDGDGKTDLAVWRKFTGVWYIVNSSNGSTTVRGLGDQNYGDIPVPGDYDGDGKADLAIWRKSTGVWYIINSSNGTTTVRGWGDQNYGDIPVPGDYDGDSKTDLAIWRKSTGVWYIINSSNGSTTVRGWGDQNYADIPVPGDYDGDSKTDLAIWRKSTGVWYIINSSNGSTTVRGWGDQIYGDIPVPGDYDGDRKIDLAIWRKSTGVWYIVNSSNGSTAVRGWGDQNFGDIPVPSMPYCIKISFFP